MRSEGVTSKKSRRLFAGALVVGLAAAAFGLVSAFADPSSSNGSDSGLPSSTPIKHVVVIFQENESFDHYFGTYPRASNPAGEPQFTAAPGTPSVNGLSNVLLTANPNLDNPRRLDRSEAVTCSQDHGYAHEQEAFDHGLMDEFVQHTAGGGCTDKTLVMDYYDGNTVTGLWNYAQHFSLSDNSFDTQFGPSTVGAINLVSGETHGATPENISGSVENGTVIGDPDPILDDCGHGGVEMSGKNIGDLLNAHNITWGWFQGGFKPTEVKEGKAVCGSTHQNVANATVTDYVPHHNPFEYYKSTANPHHLPPTSVAMIGHTDQANHEYDIGDFGAALNAGNLPAVSFLKAPAYENGHPSNSDPLDEQRFVAETINSLEQSPEWSSTAVVIAYDDSDGWYDHVMPTIDSPSESPSDSVSEPGMCGHVTDSSAPKDRCGFGPRLPLQMISPYAKQNYVDSTQTDQTSIIHFIEDNWQLGRIGGYARDAESGTLANMFEFAAGAPTAPRVFIDPETGEVTGVSGGGGEEGEHGHGGGDHGHGGGGDDHGHGHGHKPPKARVSCDVDGGHRSVELACRVSGGGNGRGAVRFRLERHGSVYGSSRAPIKGSRANATISSSHELQGSYELVATVDRRAGVSALSKSVALPGKAKVNLR